MININTLPEKEFFQGFRGKFIHTQNNTLGFWHIDKGATLPIHSHVHEQVTQVLEGQFELTVGDQTHIYEAGSVAVIPPHVPHGGTALTDCKIFDIFCPVREDYKI